MERFLAINDIAETLMTPETGMSAISVRRSFPRKKQLYK
jgi:hypothetical protein